MWMGGDFGGELIHIYMYGWVPSLFTWNYHNIFKSAISQYKIKSYKLPKKKEREREKAGEMLSSAFFL